jgi:hypothetical protein
MKLAAPDLRSANCGAAPGTQRMISVSISGEPSK